MKETKEEEKEIPLHVKIKFGNVTTDAGIHWKPKKKRGSERVEQPKMKNNIPASNKRSGSKLEFYFHEMK